MKLDFIPIDKLSIAAANMRGKGKDPDVSDLLPSMRSRGVLVPLLFVPIVPKAISRSSRGGGALLPSMPSRVRAGR